MHFEWLAPTMSGLAHESQCLKGVAKSAAVVDGEEVWKISGAGLSEPVINSPLARLVGRVKIAEVEAPPKKKPCEALAPRALPNNANGSRPVLFHHMQTLSSSTQATGGIANQ